MKYLDSLLLFFSFSGIAQTYVYVSSSSLNLRSEATVESNRLKRLTQYDNLTIQDTVNAEWIRVKSGSQIGYVHNNYVKRGRAKVTIVRGARIGAYCKDGTTSTATGRGACSHHGGVSSWRYSESKKVEIIANR